MEDPAAFPGYLQDFTPPNPQGIPLAHPKFAKPLNKMIKQMMNPNKVSRPMRKSTTSHRRKVKTKFY